MPDCRARRPTNLDGYFSPFQLAYPLKYCMVQLSSHRKYSFYPTPSAIHEEDMNILLVYPKYPDTFWSFKTVMKYISKKAAFPPLGLMTVGAMLPREWTVSLVDVNTRPLLDKQIKDADMVFISAMIVQQDSAREIVQRCKALGTSVVAGGPLFLSRHDQFPEVDHFVLNEAEITLPLFLEDLKKGTPQRMYSSDVRPDISTTPAPDWSLARMKDYATMSVQYSRGCPFNCEFCDIIVMNGRTPRTKAPAQIMAEFDSLYAAGWRGGVFIVDDNFIGNTNEVKKMLPLLIQWQKERRYPFQFLTEASVNLADDSELMQLMSQANFHKVFLGIETPEVDSLRECGKHQNATRNLVQAVQTIQRHGMQVMGGFIVGFDNDTESTFDAQVRFIQQVGIVTAMVGLLNVLPHTRLWRRLSSENRLLDDSKGENTDGSLNFIPKMDRQTLLDGYHHVISQLYSRRMYYKRIKVFLKNYTPTVKSRFTMNDLQALIKSMYKIGLFSRASILYWQLVLKTAFTNIKLLPVVMDMIICGEHFNKMRKRLQSMQN
jgi:radical SAM superfamily enzyme YgiQ (UPF0313 family)